MSLSIGMKRFNTMRFQIIAILLFCSIFTAYHNVRFNFTPCYSCEHSIDQSANDIIDGTARYPFKYRILAPYITSLAGHNLYAVFVIHLVFRLALFSALAWWVSRWQGDIRAALLLCALILVLMQETWFSSNYNYLEAIFILIGWSIATYKPNKARIAIIAVLMAIGGTVRETTPFLIGIGLFVLWFRHWHLWLALGVIGVASIVAVRFGVGYQSMPYTIVDVWGWNMDEWRLQNAIRLNLLLAPAYVAMGSAFVKMPTRYRVFMVLLSIYLVMILLYGVWGEVRLQLPLVVAALPMLRYR